MKHIGKTTMTQEELDRTKGRRLNDLTPSEHQQVLEDFKGKHWDPAWNNQQHANQGLTFPTIASKYGNVSCGNDKKPDPSPPPELFNFDLILNGRRFRVVCDTLMRINTDEDLTDFSEAQLKNVLEKVASYRATCFCAYIGAHREYRKWKIYFELWMAQKRNEARKAIRTDRLIDHNNKLRKEIGQIPSQEVEDWIMVKHEGEYKWIQNLVNDWEENEKVFLELRDTLKDRGMHLQTLLKRVDDQRIPKGDGSSLD